MNANAGARKGVRFVITSGMIREYLKLSPEMRLAWLQEGIILSYSALAKDRMRIWQKFRKGEI